VPPLVSLVVAWLLGALLVAAAHADPRAGEAAVPEAALVAALLLALAVTAWSATAAGPGRLLLPAAVLALGCASGLLAHAAWRTHARCLTLLGDPSQPLLLRLDATATPGAWVRAEARFAGAPSAGAPSAGAPSAGGAAAPSTLAAWQRRCRVPASVGVRHGQAPPGAWVRAQGVRVSTTALLRLDEVTVEPTGAIDWLRGWRGRTAHTIDTLFGDRAPLVRALLVADQHGVDAEVRDRFATAGLVHLLSISGLHVAIIAGALRVLGAAVRLRRGTADLLALAGVGGYVVLLGVPAPAARAASMLTVLVLAGRLGRPVHPWTPLAIGVLLPALDPRVVATLGWQLSASGMAALVGARTLMRRWRTHPVEPALPRTADAPPCGWLSRGWRRLRAEGPRLEGWQRALVQELVISTMASVVTAPLVAWAFGRVSLVAPFANLAAAPIVSLLQPTLFLALVLAPIPPLARFVADASRVPLALLDHVATAASTVPAAALDVAPGRLTALCMGLLAAMLVLATARRRPGPPLLAGGAAVVVAVWAPVLRPGPGLLELHVLDVGQGDALALRTPRGHWVLVDAGRVWTGGDAGRRTVVPYVRRRGGDVALFVLSHPDADHVGGAPTVLDALRPARWWDPGFVHTSNVYRDALTVAERRGIPWRRVQTGDSLRVDGVLLRVLGPDSAWTASQRSANDASTVLLVEHGQVRLLLTGDAEAAQEAQLVQAWGNALEATVLKLGHHGSRTSSTAAFLDAVQPRVALVSVGAGNRYGHPAPEVLAALRARGVDVLRTDRDGVLVLRTDGRTLDLETRHTRWHLPVAPR
jgi:competence protein ComEC